MKKQKVVFAYFYLLSISMFAFSQEISINDYKIVISKTNLQLGDFPTKYTFSGKHSNPILDTDFKRKYRTIINSKAKENPNFNGKYCIVEFGYGSSVHYYFIIDLETGVVFNGMTNEFGIQYSIDSRLLIINPSEPIIEYWNEEKTIPIRCKTSYVLFENGDFIHLLNVNPGKE